MEDDLVKRLYEAIPEFKKVNDPFFDAFDHTVYGNFGLFLDDLVQLLKYKKIIDPQFSCKEDLSVDFLDKSLHSVISRCFRFIDKLYLTMDVHSRSVVVTSFFRIVATSKNLRPLAYEFLSEETFNKLVEYGSFYWSIPRDSYLTS